MTFTARAAMGWVFAALLLASCKRGGGGGGGDSGGPPPPPPVYVADLDVDTDRNGSVDAGDDTGEDAWTATLGAVFYFNTDDDDNGGTEDHVDTAVGGSADELDLARVLIRQMSNAPTDASATVFVSAPAQGRVKIHRRSGSIWSLVYSTGPVFSVPIADIIAGDIELGIEGVARMSPVWDGTITLTLEVRDAAAALLDSDAVLLRCAPWLMSTNLWLAEELAIVNLGSENLPFRSAVSSACSAAGISYVEIPGATYSYDRWVQDSHETGAVLLPASGAPRRRVDHVLQCARWRPVDAWCRNVLFGPDFDIVARFSSNASSLNYGGNLEITGPHTAPNGTPYPWGRILIGGGTSAPIGGGSPITRRMVQVYRDYLNALAVQAPFLEVSTEWLAVAHMDEHTMLVPAPANPRGWAILFASPALAVSTLEAVQAAGGGNLAVFAGRGSWETTVDAILNDSALMTYNDEVQARLDAIRAQYRNELGLADSEIIDLPTLFEPYGSSGAVAYSPGLVNLIVLPAAGGTTYLIFPDPEGPDQSGDIWQAETLARVQPLYTMANPVVISFADIFNSYHVLLGEAHCGINTVRTPPDEDWWDD